MTAADIPNTLMILVLACMAIHHEFTIFNLKLRIRKLEQDKKP